MLDPSLSFSVHSNKGVYALLLGSGISRSAEIPTGWEITLDLVKQLARIQDENCDQNPEEWYKSQYGKKPDYSQLWKDLVKSPAERAEKLRPYFEPTDEEREEGKKQPTETHRAIAKLVAKGYIRVIVTTNFDRLLELALQDEGITPNVIDTANTGKGSVPLCHSNCTIIKVNGDYKHANIKNTADELKSYEPEINKLLDQVFDEYGLIVCGWSGDWDDALREAVERCPSRRYSMYWAAKDGVRTERAIEVCQHRRAEVISIADSDSFFSELKNGVNALEEYNQPHPLSTPILIATLKRYLVKDEYRIKLQDLIQNACRETLEKIENFHHSGRRDFKTSFQFMNNTVQGVMSILVNGIVSGNHEQEEYWIRAVELLTSFPFQEQPRYIDPKKYFKLLILYLSGITCIYREDYALLKKIWFLNLKPYSENPEFVLSDINTAVNSKALNNLGQEPVLLPTSTWLVSELRPYFRNLIPNEDKYHAYFDATEYLFGLVGGALYEKKYGKYLSTYGLFNYRKQYDPLLGAGQRIIEENYDKEMYDWKLHHENAIGFSLPEGSEFTAYNKKYNDFLATRVVPIFC